MKGRQEWFGQVAIIDRQQEEVRQEDDKASNGSRDGCLRTEALLGWLSIPASLLSGLKHSPLLLTKDRA
jgi:hypothetical protein